MMVKNDLLFYIKTTETCNLNCSHCFTSGKNGKKIFFDAKKTADWCNLLTPGRTGHFEFHGGEPFLAPIESMWDFYYRTRDSGFSYGATTNLVFKLNDDKLDFMDNVLNKRIGTSWDSDIRFENKKQLDLWEHNIKLLLDRGYTIKLFVSLSRSIIDMEPINLLQFVKELGVQELALERLTLNGSARKNPLIFPSNLDLQYWFLKMYEQTKQYNARSWFKNDFLENVYKKFENNFNSAGTFCRDCEQKLFTINADGSISGCPNAAPEEIYGHISEGLTVLDKPKRCDVITKELSRDPRCYSCNMYKYCKGDCHQLEWEDDVCPAPKLLMIKMDEEINGYIN
jgi:radical SAM protein with 4Fe4S-binding SPASM domain